MHLLARLSLNLEIINSTSPVVSDKDNWSLLNGCKGTGPYSIFPTNKWDNNLLKLASILILISM